MRLFLLMSSRWLTKLFLLPVLKSSFRFPCLKEQTRFKSTGIKVREERECFYCHKTGHVIADCLALRRKQQTNAPKSVAFVRL